MWHARALVALASTGAPKHVHGGATATGGSGGGSNSSSGGGDAEEQEYTDAYHARNSNLQVRHFKNCICMYILYALGAGARVLARAFAL